MLFADRGHYPAEQVRLAQPNGPVEHERIEPGHGVLCHANGCGMGHAVGWSDDEVIECLAPLRLPAMGRRGTRRHRRMRLFPLGRRLLAGAHGAEHFAVHHQPHRQPTADDDFSGLAQRHQEVALQPFLQKQVGNPDHQFVIGQFQLRVVFEP